MAKVYGIHEVELCPGVTGQALEKYFVEELQPQPFYPGWKLQLVKADRGERAGKYAVLIEIESVEARDRIAPSGESLSDEARAVEAEFPESVNAAWNKWGTYMTTSPGVDTIFSDYIAVV